MKKLFIAIVAMFFLTVVPSMALAMTVDVKDIATSSSPISMKVSEVVPVKVTHTASENATDVVIEVVLTYKGKKTSVESIPMDLISGTTYTETLDLSVPKNMRITSPGEYYTLTVKMTDGKGKEIERKSFDVTVQRNNNDVEIQKVIVPSANSGEPALVTVVAKNLGIREQEDVYVKISIPAIGLVAEERMGDVLAVDKGEEEDVAVVEVPLRIPENVAKGFYTMEVEVYNSDDIDVTSTERIYIESSITSNGKFIEVVPAVKSQDVSQGKTAVFMIRIANLGDKVETYNVTVEGTNGWAVYQINPLVSTLNPNSDQVITVGITPAQNALSGEHNFVVKVASENAEKSISLTANVSEQVAKVDSMLVSVIVLAVVLVILIAILVKTRKSEDVEETEESYY